MLLALHWSDFDADAGTIAVAGKLADAWRGFSRKTPLAPAPYPARTPNCARTALLPQAYRSSALAVPNLQAALQFGLARQPIIYQAFPLTHSIAILAVMV